MASRFDALKDNMGLRPIASEETERAAMRTAPPPSAASECEWVADPEQLPMPEVTMNPPPRPSFTPPSASLPLSPHLITRPQIQP